MVNIWIYFFQVSDLHSLEHCSNNICYVDKHSEERYASCGRCRSLYRDAILAGAQGFCAASVFGLRPTSAETPLLLRTYTTLYTMMMMMIMTMMMPTMTIWCWLSTTYHLYIHVKGFSFRLAHYYNVNVIKSLLILFLPKFIVWSLVFFLFNKRFYIDFPLANLQWALYFMYLCVYYTQYTYYISIYNFIK